ncbi:MAG: pseudouridylate synthase [Crocinitomicaceae bacterium]|nr:pseudouridylate synthase [Crocinitomicaceae bacterium]
MLEILFENEDLIAINKPHGLLVHWTKLDKHATEFALQLLRDQIGQEVHPCHRLDRKTSGVLLFAKSRDALVEVRNEFEANRVQKVYHAIVRGHTPDTLFIDYPLTEEEKTQEAQTELKTLERFEINLPFGGFPTSRYSLVELKPQTGRFHQLRKHMKHIFHPILGDRPHGCNKQNKLWKEQYEMTTMMLCARELQFKYKEEQIRISANYSQELKRTLNMLIH